MRNLTAVFLVTTMIGAGGTLPLAAQTPPPAAAPAPAALPPAAPAAATPAMPAATPPADAAEEARHKTEAGDRAAMFEAHLAALHAGLTLAPDQEKLWPPVDSAIRTFAKMRETLHNRRMDAEQDRVEDAQAPEDHADEDPVAALKTYSDGLLQRAQALKGLSDAVEPLYATLNDDQKHRIPLLLRDMAPKRGPVAKMVERMGDGDRGPRGRDPERMDDGERGNRGDRHWGHGPRGDEEGRGYGREDEGRRAGRDDEAYGDRADRDHDGPPRHRGWRDQADHDEMD